MGSRIIFITPEMIMQICEVNSSKISTCIKGILPGSKLIDFGMSRERRAPYIVVENSHYAGEMYEFTPVFNSEPRTPDVGAENPEGESIHGDDE